MKFRLVVLIAAVALLLQAFGHSTARAGAPADRIRRMMGQVMTIQTDPKLEGAEHRQERRTSIKKIIAESIDFDAMSKKALGEYWQKLSAAQRAEFKSLFRDLFQDSYSRMVLSFIKQEEVRYHSEDLAGNRAVVKTSIVRANDAIAVDYSLLQTGGEWLVDDVVVDGVSIAGNYEKSFSRVIKTQSFDALLEKMRLQQKALAKS